MVDEMISTVRAAFAPNADPQTKQQAAAILRGLLAMLEPGASASAAPPAGALAAPATAPPDVLAAIVESVRPLLPPETLAKMPRFRVPFIKTSG
jgi:hypothetical protein